MVDVGDDGSVNSNERPVFNVVTVPDSADARLFVELSSYGADLAEARHALDLAIKSRVLELRALAAGLEIGRAHV